MIQTYCGDCLRIMDCIPDKSVDLILCDLPYGTTWNKWDSPIELEPLWAQYNRIIKENGAVVLFSDEPFTTKLISSNPRAFRYKWIWDKKKGSNFQNAHFMPMKSHEEICVFYKRKPTYNPQYWFSTPYMSKGGTRNRKVGGLHGGSAAHVRTPTVSEDGRRYPLSILSFPRDGKRVHEAQKPVALCEYLIKTYTNEGDIVLDNCMGSGSVGVACVKTKRRFIGIEIDEHYYNTAVQRIREAGNDV